MFNLSRQFAGPIDRRLFLSSCGALAVGSVASRVAVGGEDRLAMRIAEVPSDHKLTPAIRIATDCIREAAALSDYTATFVKSELVKNTTMNARIAIKIRHEPFSLYMKFISPSAGRELIYVDGKAGGNLQVHETGLASLVGTLTLDPKGKLAMGESRYPVTMMGIKTLVETVVDQWVNETARTNPEVQYYPNATLGNIGCKAIQSTHAEPGRNVRFQRTRLYIAKDSGLPVRVQQYDFNRRGGEPILVEDYAYLNLDTNVGLTDLDFDTSNPAYSF